jgi:hypothetical protein
MSLSRVFLYFSIFVPYRQLQQSCLFANDNLDYQKLIMNFLKGQVANLFPFLGKTTSK